MKSDTPRTNFEESQQTQRLGVRSSFARQLEQELNEALKRIDNLEASGIHSCGTHCQRPACKARRERDEARKAAKDLAKTILLHVREHEDEQGVRLAREWSDKS